MLSARSKVLSLSLFSSISQAFPCGNSIRSTASLSPPFVGMMEELSQVTLDTTLAELCARGSGEDHERRIAMALCAANSEIAPTSRLARNTKYLYQDSTFSTKSKFISFKEVNDIQHAVAVKYLSLVPPHDAFAAGKMPVILFNLDNSEGDTAHSKQEAEKTIYSLIILQRPTLVFLPSPKQISVEEIGVDLLAAKMELDQLEGFSLAIDLQEISYDIFEAEKVLIIYLLNNSTLMLVVP